MTEKGVNLAEPDDIETLNLATISIHSWNDTEYVRIGVIPEDAAGPDGTISFQLVQFHNNAGNLRERGMSTAKSLQANLTKPEIDIVIDGLQKAKERFDHA